MLKDLVIKSRSYRRFHQDFVVKRETLRELIDIARFSPSAANMQPLKYILSCDPEENALIFSHLAWAGYLKDWPGPEQDERPPAYIIIVGDTDISKNFYCDHGIAAQGILLAATEKGLGGCIIGSINRDNLRKDLKILSKYEILLVLAIGKPKKAVKLETSKAGDIKYWRDSKGAHHVPKRSLDEVIL